MARLVVPSTGVQDDKHNKLTNLRPNVVLFTMDHGTDVRNLDYSCEAAV